MAAALAAAVMTVTPAAARVEAVEFATARQAALYADLLLELRCLVCANQSIGDSNADLASDLRAKVRAMVASGHSRAEIVAYMVARYGDYVMYRPRFSAATALLWLGPFLVLLGGLAFVWRLTAKARRTADDRPLDKEQRA